MGKVVLLERAPQTGKLLKLQHFDKLIRLKVILVIYHSLIS